MRILCAYSSLHFECSHFPAYLHERECYHPIFAIEQKKLFQYTHRWGQGNLNPTDSYLLYLAFLNSTSLIEWRSPAKYTPTTDKIVASNMESLVRIIGRMNLISNPSVGFHKVAITSSTCDLSNSKYWIENWNKAFEDFQSGYSARELHDQIIKREQQLQRLIKDPNKPISSYARTLAEWAALSADFPATKISLNSLEPETTISEYWKSLIIRAARADNVYTLPLSEVSRLIEYLELNLEMGSIYSYELMNMLRKIVSRNATDIGFMSLDTPNYHMINDGDIAGNMTEAANILSMIESAPSEEPVEKDYSSKFAFLKARAAWMASKTIAIPK